MKKIALLVPDGVGIKNYLYADVFKNTKASLSLFHNFDTDTLSHINKNIAIDKHIEIPNYKESIREKFLRELIHLARIKFNAKKTKNPTILKFWKKKRKSFALSVFYFGITFASYFYKSYSEILNLEEKYQIAIRKNSFYQQVSELLKKEKPDILFCTHQRALKAPSIFAAAKDLGINTNTVIYSWDNIPKARLALKADYYLVWSAYMKEELELFYPEISSDKIKITGTPQFEFYQHPENIIEKEVFFKTYGINNNKKLICFSGDDVLTSPYDPNYLNDIASAIMDAGMDKKYQIILRRCPVDISGRFDWVVKKYSNLIIEIPPLWNFNSEIWSAVYPTYDDVKLLVSLAYYSDLVINVGSTMAFDFGMFNKPCVFINYDHQPDNNWSVNTIYKYQHFRSMPSKNAVYWLNDQSEVIAILNKALNKPQTKIKEWFNVIVDHPIDSSKKIKNKIL